MKTKNEAKISVIITTYNRLESLKRALSSVYNQNFEKLEIIIVNDGSTDGTKEYLDDLRKGMQSKEDFIIIHQPNKGSVYALNEGLRHTRGKYICILDDDDKWTDPLKLQKEYDYLEANPDVVVVGTNAKVNLIKNGFVERVVITNLLLADKEIREKMIITNMVAHSSAMYRASEAKQVGGYDISFPRGKDWDLFLKLGKLGKFANIPDVCVEIDEKRDVRIKFPDSKAKLRVMWKHRDYPHFLHSFFIECFRFIVFLILSLWGTKSQAVAV